MSQKDYYETLGVQKNASQEEIKKAFYKLAAKSHPDKKGGDEAKFKEYNEAYQILSDDKKRKEYDMYGQTFNQGFSGGQNNSGASGFGGFDFSGFQDFQQNDFQNMNFEFEDLGNIFGDFFGGGFANQSRQKRGRDMSLELDITFSESIFGTERNVLINKISKCQTCSATGMKSGSKMETCGKCSGKGKIHDVKKTIFGAIQSVQMCTECEGKGQVATDKCLDCRGAGIKNKKEDIKINIPTGINNGEVIRMSGMGEAVKDGKSGDLYVKIIVTSHKMWFREGQNLIMTQNLKLSDALLGAEYNISTLEGEMKINIPAGSHMTDVLRIKNKGVPNSQNKNLRGDILIKLNIQMPKKLSHKAENLIKELREEGV